MRRARHAAIDDPADLGELVHQADLVLQTPGGVDQNDVATTRHGCVDAVEGDRRGIAAVRRPHEVRVGALGPGTQLLVGRGTEGVGRRHDDGLADATEMLGEFADGGRLARPVDADHQDDRRLV